MVSVDTVAAAAQRILHFDPNDSTRKVTTTGLRLQGFSVKETTSLQEATDSASGEHFDAAVIDCSDADAAATLAQLLKDLETPIPTVLLTERSNRVPFEGARDYPGLVRPFASPALGLVLAPLLGEPESTSVERSVTDISEDNLTPIPEMVHVGEYQLITEIARGGMGTVYVARRSRDAGVNRLYALKLLHAHLSDDEKFVSMLRDEASLASRINHQNVVSVNDVGNDGSQQHFIVMDYVEGLSLSKLLKRKNGAIPEDILASIFVDTLEGLHGAHSVADGRGNSLELIHRDVSPENILVGTDGAARISDFGVAKARIRLTQTLGGVRKGKIAYLSPEQLIDDDTVDRRVDIWASGVALWGALTGQSLFAEGVDSEAKILRRILELDVPPPSTVGRKPSPFLDDIVLKALDRDLGERYQTAREMSEAIRAAAMSSGLLASKAKVGEFVLSACEAEVRQRREIARVSAASSSSAPAADRSEFVSTEVGSDPAVLTATAEDEDDGSNKKIVPFFLIGVAAAALLGVGWYMTQSDDPAPDGGSKTASAAQSKPEPAPAPSPAPNEDPAAGLAAEDEPDDVVEIEVVEPDANADPAAEAEVEAEDAEPAAEDADESADRRRRRPSRSRRKPKPTSSEPGPDDAGDDEPEPAAVEPEPKPEPKPKPKPKAEPKKSDSLSEPNPYR